MTAPKKMTPSTNPVPFNHGILLTAPIVTKIDRGIRDLAVNYKLKGRLLPILTMTTNTTNPVWNFVLYVLPEEETRGMIELIEANELPKPIVNVTHKSIGGLNKFLIESGRTVAKKYGQTATANQRKTA